MNTGRCCHSGQNTVIVEKYEQYLSLPMPMAVAG